MNEILSNLSEYYPVQPDIPASQKDVSYTELTPDIKLKQFIYCYWQLKTKIPLKNSFHYRVVSDGCIDIFFEINNPSVSHIMGFCRKYTEFDIGNEFNYIGIRFLPSMFPLLFKIDAKTLSNQSNPLESIAPKLSNAIQARIGNQKEFKRIASGLDELFISIIAKREFELDIRFYKALDLIYKNNGNVSTEKDLNTGLSPRQLRRIFNYYIGTTPKVFSNVVRFQYILNAEPKKDNKIYLDVGFFDQAHFIKDFRKFYGITPTEAFQ